MKASDVARMKIGEFARAVDVPTHVLRHWEDTGILAPTRDASGYRRYSDSDIMRVTLIRRSQSAGMTLGQIRALVSAGLAGRRELLRAHLDSLDQRQADIERSRAMTEHALQCRAHDVTTCPNFVRHVSAVAQGKVPDRSFDGVPD